MVKLRKIFPHIFFIILVIIFILLNRFNLEQDIASQSLSVNPKTVSLRTNARVLRVIDGDTIEVSLNNKKQTVRLIGIDSPEIYTNDKIPQCFAKEALIAAKEKLNGKDVILELDSSQGDKDKYGRLLRYVFIGKLNFNHYMISNGYAKEYTFKNNPYKYQSEFKRIENDAKTDSLGLWATCD